GRQVWSAVVSSQAFQRPAASLKIHVFVIGHTAATLAALKVYIAQALRLTSPWQRSEKHCIDAAENGHVRPDAQRECDDGQQSEAGRFRQRPCAITQVLPNTSKHIDPPVRSQNNRFL